MVSKEIVFYWESWGNDLVVFGVSIQPHFLVPKNSADIVAFRVTKRNIKEIKVKNIVNGWTCI